ncbi:hypothetical protein [Streptomyces sp. NPDC058279]|uniref:hypothetical protein n=1 Tax=Streptomyces sp. NPDC058279 TaxID=3346418 RepID=UPI0036ED1118
MRPHIVNHLGFRTDFGAPRRRPELPAGFVALVFTFDGDLWVSRTADGPVGTAGPLRPASPALISGPRTVPAVGVHAGEVHAWRCT